MSELRSVEAFLRLFVGESDPPSLIVPADFDGNEFTNAWADAQAAIEAWNRRTPAPVRAEGEAITDVMVQRAYTVPLIANRGPDVFDRDRIRAALSAALKAEDSLHG